MNLIFYSHLVTEFYVSNILSITLSLHFCIIYALPPSPFYSAVHVIKSLIKHVLGFSHVFEGVLLP